jgi:hypothetical protein
MSPTPNWTPDELERLAAEDEIDLASFRRDGSARSPVTMWMVIDEGDVYVRAVKGVDGPWYRHLRGTDRARVTGAGVDTEVAVEDAGEDPALGRRLDAAYRAKYSRYAAGTVRSVVTPAAKGSTLRLVPQR